MKMFKTVEKIEVVNSSYSTTATSVTTLIKCHDVFKNLMQQLFIHTSTFGNVKIDCDTAKVELLLKMWCLTKLI